MKRRRARVLVADPPWPFGDKLPGPKRGAGKHYGTMKVDDIASFDLPPIADDALLFLWRVGAMLPEAIHVAQSWGFTVKSEMVWVKTRASTGEFKLHFGMGRYVRMAHESCLVCSRGKGVRLVRDHSVRSVFFAPAGPHSEKPDKFYGLVERLSPGPYVELFARRRRPGWDQYGDELPGA